MTRNSNSDVTKATGTALSNIDQELATEAADLRKQLDAPTTNKIKVEVTGDIILPDGTNLGRRMDVVVVDFYSRFQLFKKKYNPNEITPPDCYAIGKIVDEMAPEDDSPEKQAPKCKDCWANQWKSAGEGRPGKACQNRFWVAVLVIDPSDPQAHNLPDAPLLIMDLSPANRRSFEEAVEYAGKSLGSPLKARFTVSTKNVGTYAKISWGDPMPNNDYAMHFARRGEAQPLLTRKPDFTKTGARR